MFDEFLRLQNKESFKRLKDNFTAFTIQHTAINQRVECGRIFTKILNPLAFQHHKKGTRKGFLSKTIISFDELKYNRTNWRDDLSGKDKLLTRQEYAQTNSAIQANTHYNIQKAKKIVRRYNEKFNNSNSEVKQQGEEVSATQIHHIFPAAEFPSISDFIENLIALTPNQHFSCTHPNNQTSYIDKDFQYICLLAKTNTIMNDKTETYNFSSYQIVLNTGLYTNEFSYVFDFSSLVAKIDYFYSDFNKNSIFIPLVQNNKPNLF